jgi:hypothetical protein
MPTQEMPTVRQYQEDGTFIDRPMTAEEIAQAEKDHANWLIEKEAIEAAALAKAALLVKLGITADEAKLLLA